MMAEEFKNRSDKIEELLKERNERIVELKEECKNLLELELKWKEESSSILLNTDFKDLYKKDNEHIRDAHLRKELSELYNNLETQNDVVNFLKMDITQIDKEIKVNDRILSFINIVNGNKDGM